MIGRFNLRGVDEMERCALTMCSCGQHMNLVMFKGEKPFCYAVVTAENATEMIDGLQRGLYRLAVEKDDDREAPQG